MHCLLCLLCLMCICLTCCSLDICSTYYYGMQHLACLDSCRLDGMLAGDFEVDRGISQITISQSAMFLCWRCAWQVGCWFVVNTDKNKFRVREILVTVMKEPGKMRCDCRCSTVVFALRTTTLPRFTLLVPPENVCH